MSPITIQTIVVHFITEFPKINEETTQKGKFFIHNWPEKEDYFIIINLKEGYFDTKKNVKPNQLNVRNIIV